MKFIPRPILVLAFFGLLRSASLQATVPQTMNYQGRVTGAGGNLTPVADSLTNTVIFSLYTVPSSGSSLWTETQNNVGTKSGFFNVVLGSVNPINLPFDQQYYLGVNFNGDGEMVPRQVMTTGPYAFNAKTAEGLAVPFTAIGASTLPILTLKQNGTGAGLSVTAATAGGYAAKIYNTAAGATGALYAESLSGGYGIYGVSTFVYGVAGTSTNADGMRGDTGGAPGTAGVHGVANNNGYGLLGESSGGIGIVASGVTAGLSATASSSSGPGVYGTSTGSNGIGVMADVASANAALVASNNGSGRGLSASAPSAEAVYALGKTGVAGTSISPGGIGVVASQGSGALALKVVGAADFTSASTVDFTGSLVIGLNANVTAPLTLSNTGAANTLTLINGGSGMAINASSTVATGSVPTINSINYVTSGASRAVMGTVSSTGSGVAIYGENLGAGNTGYGVTGENGGSGNLGAGVFGVNSSSSGFGIDGLNSANVGVIGQGKTGVWGQAIAAGGAGVLADWGSQGMALKVSGPARFDSGNVTFNAHVDFSNATVTGLTLAVPNPLFLLAAVSPAVITGNNISVGPGVSGTSASGTGVYGNGLIGMAADGGNVGLTVTSNSIAVYGRSNAGGGFIPGALFEVQGTNHAVEGRNTFFHSIGMMAGDPTNGPTGIYGFASPNGGSKGVWGLSAGGYGVYGQGLTGVAGVVTQTGQIAVLADAAGFANSLALKVNGPATFGAGSVTFATHVDFSGATITGWSLPSLAVPTILSGGIANPGGVFQATNTGTGFGIKGIATQPGFVGGSGVALNSTLTAGIFGYSNASISAGVIGRNDDTSNSNAGVIGLSANGTGVLGQTFGTGSTAGDFKADSGTAVSGQGNIGVYARATTPSGYALKVDTNNQVDRMAMQVNGATQFTSANGGSFTTQVVFDTVVAFHQGATGLSFTPSVPLALTGGLNQPVLQASNTITSSVGSAAYFSAANGTAVQVSGNDNGPALSLNGGGGGGVGLNISSTTASFLMGINGSVSNSASSGQVWGSNLQVNAYGASGQAQGHYVSVYSASSGGNAATGIFAYASAPAGTAIGVDAESQGNGTAYGAGVKANANGVNAFGVDASNASGVGIRAFGNTASILLASDMNAGGNRILGLDTNPAQFTEAVALGYLQNNYVSNNGGNITGTLTLNSSNIYGVDSTDSSPGGIGVHGNATNGWGGWFQGTQLGVRAESATGWGVYVLGGSAGVTATATGGDGVLGITNANGFGGVHGASVPGADGVFAENTQGTMANNGSALRVKGRMVVTSSTGVPIFNDAGATNSYSIAPASANAHINFTQAKTGISSYTVSGLGAYVNTNSVVMVNFIGVSPPFTYGVVVGFGQFTVTFPAVQNFSNTQGMNFVVISQE